jgi:hypothetical protein
MGFKNNPSFHSKTILDLSKKWARKLFTNRKVPENSIFGKPFLAAIFTSLKYKISTKRRNFWYPIWPIQRKKFSSHTKVGSMCTFYELQGPKLKQPLNISENVFCYKQVFYFPHPFKLLGRTSAWASKSLLPNTDVSRCRKGCRLSPEPKG